MTDLALKPTEKVKKTYTSQDSLRQQNPFMPTYIEWLFQRAALKIIYNYTNNGTVTLYTVPKGKEFYITALDSNVIYTGATSSSARWNIAGITNILHNELRTADEVSSHNISFAFPIRLQAGDTIQIYSHTNDLWHHGTVFGYEIDKSLIPQF